MMGITTFIHISPPTIVFGFFLFCYMLSPCTTLAQVDVDKQQRPRIVQLPQTPVDKPKQPMQQDRPIEVGEGDIVRVETQLVVIPTVVLDENKRPLVNLKIDN